MIISFYLVLCRNVAVFLMALSPTNAIAHHSFFSQIEAAIYLEPDLNEVKCPYSGKDVEVANKAETVNIFSMYDNVWFNTTVNKFQLLFKFIIKYLISYFLKCCVSFPNPFAFKRRQWPLSSLHFANKICCNLTVWWLKDLAIIRIARMKTWRSILKILISRSSYQQI